MDKKLRHERILDCRYYNGEDNPPNDEYALFWNYERGWANGEHEGWEGEKRELKSLGLENFEPNDGTQYDFKCLLYNRYCHWSYGFDPEDFLAWYINKYQKPRMTNRQRRYLHRKAKLLKMCRFYKGEEDCPYKEEKDVHFWKYEMIWVDRLSRSYTYADKWRDELIPYKKIQAYIKEQGLPSSYIGLLVNRDLHWLGMIDEQDFVHSIKSDYLKITE